MNIHKISGLCIAAVWIFHGLYSKILDGVPRHKMIVARILGEDIAKPATMFIGALEVMLGLWVILEKRKRLCAATQTAALVTMNSLEKVFPELGAEPAGQRTGAAPSSSALAPGIAAGPIPRQSRPTRRPSRRRR